MGHRASGYLLGGHRDDDVRLAKHPDMGHEQPLVVNELGRADQRGVCPSGPTETEEIHRERRDEEADRKKVGLGHRGTRVHASCRVLVLRDGLDRSLEERSGGLLSFADYD